MLKSVCNKWSLYYLFPFLTRETYLQSSSKVLERLPFLPLLFLPPYPPPPRPWPNVGQNVNVCARNCSVISQH